MKIVPATVDCASGIAGVHARSWQDQRGIKFHEAFGFVPVPGSCQYFELGGRQVEEICLLMQPADQELP